MSVTPQFVDVNGRRLFCLRVEPNSGTASHRLMVLPPFGEEMNKSRPVLARLLPALATLGYACLVPDLFGTGDSEGHLDEVAWRDWRDDLVALDAWFAARAGDATPVYLGIRSGALLLPAVLGENRATTPARVLLWQPVTDGARFLQQFLRIRVMASRMAGGNESQAMLEALLEQGESVEVAGYMLSAGLTRGLRDSRLTELPAGRVSELVVFECKAGASADTALTAPSAQLLARCAADGMAATGRVIDGEAYWASQEINLADALRAATLEALA